MTAAPAIVILGPGALDTARRIQARYDGARVHALAGRAEADVAFRELGPHLRELYARGAPIVALFAAGIAIRCVAPCLADKGAEPPVLAVAEDGSAVVPLLGGLAGANALAREIADTLGVAAAITTSGELRFGACMLNPPEGYALADLDAGKRFVSDLLAGESTRIEGDARWLDDVALPRDAHAAHAIRVTPHASRGGARELLIHPRSVVAALGDDADNVSEHDAIVRASAAANALAASPDLPPLAARIVAALAARDLAPLALAAIVAPARRIADRALTDAARALRVPLRFVETNARDAAGVLDAALPAALAPRADASRAGSGPGSGSTQTPHDIAIAVAGAPVDADTLGVARGRLTVLGLGPGRADLMTPAARAALADATDIVGYATYVNMAGPLRADQQLHLSENREELQRARHAFELAAQGRRVVVVSSGDPGVFAMAAAVLEALDGSNDTRWAAVELDIVPGVSAALATAAEAGAPLGHDFCLISLSDNLKPWAIIEKRIDHAAAADFALAFYNPVSRARPVQFDRALDVVRRHRAPETVVVLGRDIGRPGATLATTTLAALSAQQVDMRTMVIVGSSTTRRVVRDGAREWVYTPRWYR
ncbi:precorrin-3B C(17)-methyltransferase [Burkholderia thailandensis]|uniref:precorrin-3B C(17)-methyltransferase n=1 Tax=Burkholderia thailandensis TaxID=57975 RepID=UPI0012E6FAD0|nr:precorrin-3B C(17)-methyltransferase [Burkholderia thailandensis]MCS3395614.1 precorrin-3B C(17)-methyltransferase [Burkholderia thailandensis]MCS6515547.1 precorrin-3B C(17)-methyltransferase [Burkholderia thailandensis]MUV21193.1 precorrin-3B C(17)-methyltransferase [Burkholderia thailandensis]QIO13590.1 precorrin-3B C(17)-methyltransferase [Burkholderia thailandensis]